MCDYLQSAFVMSLDQVPSPILLALLVAVLMVIAFFLGWLFAYLKHRSTSSDVFSDMEVVIMAE